MQFDVAFVVLLLIRLSHRNLGPWVPSRDLEATLDVRVATRQSRPTHHGRYKDPFGLSNLPAAKPKIARLALRGAR